MRILRLETSSLAIVASVFLITPNIRAQEGTEKSAEATAEKVRGLEQEYSAAKKEWLADYRAASKEDRAELMSSRPLPATWFPKFYAILEANPKAGAAARAGMWIVSNRAARGSDLAKTLGILQVHHVDNQGMDRICSSLSRNPSQSVVKFLKTVAAKSPHTDIRGIACLNLAMCLKNQADTVRKLKTGDESQLRRVVDTFGRETVDILKNADADEIEKAAESYFAKVTETPEYADVTFRRSLIAETAEASLFEMRNLGIGKVAPEIDGEDIEANPIKLSDYRGKVVVLDFWGDW